MDASNGDGKRWTFLTNHARVLIHIAGNPNTRVRDIAERISITERTTQGIVNDLEEASYITRTRVGRRNRYEVQHGGKFRHPGESHGSVDDLLKIFVPTRR